MSTAITGTVVDDRLGALAADANREHAACIAAAAAALRHAIATGEFLLQARELVPRGEWEQWVFNNFRAPTMSRPYMRLARYKHLLPGDVELSQIEALRYLRGLPGTHGGSPQHEIDRLRDEGVRLRTAGFSQRETASILGVTKNTIARWDKAAGPKQIGAKREALLEERRQVRQDKRRYRRALVAAGAPRPIAGSLEQAQEHVLSASEVLRALVRREENAEARGALVDALARLALIDDNLDAVARLSRTHCEDLAA